MATTKRTGSRKGAASSSNEKGTDAKGTKTSSSKDSAGAAILKDLGLTDAELKAFLPADAPKWLRAAFWCQFDCDLSLDELARHFEKRFAVEIVVEPKFPDPGPPDGIPVRQVIFMPAGRYAQFRFYGMRGERYVEDGSVQLEVSFGSLGAPWGSNRAVYERFKQLELPAIGARNVVERTD
ncbi:MAG: hypothetical protein JNK05_14860 [Myxococcales bacterium]|nr:hypothetical protein [Myxococcales bacterium]